MNDDSAANFKKVLDFFDKTSVYQFLFIYKAAFLQCFESDLEKTEFTALFDALDSSHKDYEKGIQSLENLTNNSPDTKLLKLSFLDLKKSSKILLFSLKNLNLADSIQGRLVTNSVSAAKIINLPTLESEPTLAAECEKELLESKFSLLLNYFNFLKEFSPITEKFCYENFNCTGKEDKLSVYVKIGKKICADPNFVGSPIQKLTKALKSPLEIKTILSGISKELNQPSQKLFIDKMFIALIGPSLSGKTQSAFAMQDLRALYFSLNQTSDLQMYQTQEIYANFHSLNKIIGKLGLKDLELIMDCARNANSKVFEVVRGGVNEKNTYEIQSASGPKSKRSKTDVLKLKKKDFSGVYAEISADTLSNNVKYENIKYFTLGFLMKLVEEGNELFVDEATNGESWMEFHARRSGDRGEFYFKAISISEARAKAKDFDKYFLFLDEFVGDFWAVLVRNLARAIGLRVVVANTNTDIGNLTGYSQARSSGEEQGYGVWSMIITSFNQMYWVDPKPVRKNSRALSLPEPTMETNLIKKTEHIINSCPDANTKKGLKVFFKHLKAELCRARPGVAEMTISVIEEFQIGDGSLTTLSFLDELFDSIASKIGMRKSNMSSSACGRLANLGLFLSNSYALEATEPVGIKELNSSSFLKDHLYYLANPVDKEDWAFMTFRPTGKGKPLQIFKSKKLTDWGDHYTYFRDSELLTVLSCMFIVSEYSILDDIRLGKSIGNNGNPDLTRIANPVASKLDGNELEIVSAVSLIDSSHHQLDSMMTTLSGQDGVTFIHNLLNNLISLHVNKSRRGKKCEMAISSVNLRRSLASMKVPFLFAANCKVPVLLKEISQAQCGVNVGECYRAADKKKVDFIFDLVLGSSEKALAIAECKNWSAAVNVPTIIAAIRKAHSIAHCRFNLIFCNSVKDFEAARTSVPAELNVSIYKTKKVGKKITWIPVIDIKDPKLTVLLFESSIINK